MSEEWFEGVTLRSWRLGNFKSVRDATVDLAPLTVVVGGNSAGKSTLLQSIRVASQAATSDLAVFPLNGEQIRPGTFAETRYAGAEDAEGIELGGEFNLGPFRSGYFDRPAQRHSYAQRPRPRRRREEDIRLKWHLTLHGTPADQSAATNVQAVEVTASQGDEQHASLAAHATQHGRSHSFGRDQHYDGRFTINDYDESVIDVSISGGFPQELLREADLGDDLFWTWHETHTSSVRSNLHRLPSSDRDEPLDLVDDEALIERIVSDIRKAVGGDPQAAASHIASRRIMVGLRELIYTNPIAVNWTQDRLLKVSSAVRHRLGWDIAAARPIPLPDLMDDALDEVRFFLANRVQHLGPLRMDPQVVYRSSPASQPGFIGAKGEYSASVLQTSGRQLTAAPMPSSSKLMTPVSGGTTLLEAVDAWAAYLGIGDAFATTDQGRLGLQLFVRQPDVDLDLDLTSVGTGVSQLLPVLVMCLHAPPGSLLLIEQPELHLNPAVQQRLADFLLAIAASGRQLIVETHSDYLVSRLRRRAAEDKSEATKDLIRIVFAEREAGVTTYHAVAPSSDGSMAEWPAGFFEEAATDSYALLSAMLDRQGAVGQPGPASNRKRPPASKRRASGRKAR